jgi:MFS family permease
MTLAGPRAGQRVKHRGFMNRVNVGFAALTMNRDLGLTSQMFGFGVGIFFVGYLVFGLPSNLLLNRIGARRMISGMMVTCGLLSGAMAFANGVGKKVGGIWPAMRNIHVLGLALVYFGTSTALYAVGIWTPLFLSKYGYSYVVLGLLAATRKKAREGDFPRCHFSD